MTTIRLKGPGLNNYFAEYTVKEHGPDGARERCSGPMLEAVERVIARMELEAKPVQNYTQVDCGCAPDSACDVCQGRPAP